ncbi:MAG TPA: hypothetical protein DD789_12955 [Firmicutes bacterium]|nr:hypothetical protein [Bacillota bacterium]
MSGKVVSMHDVEPEKLIGRDLTWLVTPETVGAENIAVAIMNCHPHATIRPMHSHKDIEEVCLILEGQGEVWIDGERFFFKKGDAIFYPANSKHQVRNTGDSPLVTASIFSAPTKPDSYITYEEDAFAEE